MMSFSVIPLSAVFYLPPVMLTISVLVRIHVRGIACRLGLPPDPILTNGRLFCLTLPFLSAALAQLFLNGNLLPPLLMQAGLLACAVADAEREWLPDSYTLPLIALALYASPLPGNERGPVMVMVLVVCLASAVFSRYHPDLLPGRGDYMLWVALTAWGGLAASALILPALLAAGLTLLFTGRDHTPLGPWLSVMGAALVPVTMDAGQQLSRFIHLLWS